MRKQLSIPDDWDGENWLCVNVQWPNSPQWRAILVGLLTYPGLGRLWDIETGTITDATAIGREIFDRSFPFTLCDGTPDPQSGADSEAGRMYLCDECDEWDEECDNMSGCCIRWYKGTLQILQCGEWVDVPEFGAKTSAIEEATGDDYSDPESPLPGDDDTVDEDIACKVAFSCAHAMRRFWLEVVDCYADVLPLVDAGNRISSRLPEYTIDKTQAAFAVADLTLAVAGGLSPSLIMADPDVYEQDLAKFLSTFMTGNYSITRAQFEAVRVALIGYGAWVEQEIGIEELAVGDFWSHVWASLGAGTLNDIAKQARLYAPGEYGCASAPLIEEPEIEYPNNAEWRLDFDFRYSDHGWTKGTGDQESSWRSGLGWRLDKTWYNGRSGAATRSPAIDTPGAGVLMGCAAVVVVNGAGEDFAPDTYDGYMVSFGTSPHRRRIEVAGITGAGRFVLREELPYAIYAPQNPYQILLGWSFALRDTNNQPVYLERLTYWGTGAHPLGG